MRSLDAVFPQLLPLLRQALAIKREGRVSESDDALLADWLDHARRGEPFTPCDPHTRRSFGLRSLKVTDGRLEIVMGPEPR